MLDVQFGRALKLWEAPIFWSLTPLISWHIIVQARIADLWVLQASGFSHYNNPTPTPGITEHSFRLPSVVCVDYKCIETKERPCTHTCKRISSRCYLTVESPCGFGIFNWLLDTSDQQRAAEEDFLSQWRINVNEIQLSWWVVWRNHRCSLWPTIFLIFLMWPAT